jgi:hypothetical protein
LIKGLPINGDHQPGSQRLRSKAELVDLTTAIHIIGFGPATQPVLKLNSLLCAKAAYGVDGWDLVGMSPAKNKRRGRRLAVEKLREFHSLMEKIEILHAYPPFGSVRTFILGERYDRGWDCLEEQDFDATGLARAYVDMFVSAHLPQSVCVYTRNGPYAFDNAYFANQGYVTRHLYENVLDLPNIIVGAINNWIFHPGSNRLTRTAKEGSILPRDMGKAERLQEGFMHRLGVLSKTAQSYGSEEYIDEMMASTGINFFGQATTEASASVVMPQSATNNYMMAERIIPDEVPDAVRDHPTQLEAYKQLQKSALTERREIQLYEGVFNHYLKYLLNEDPVYQRDWSTRARILNWRNTSPWECCGWNVEEVREEAFELLPLEEVERYRLWFG